MSGTKQLPSLKSLRPPYPDYRDRFFTDENNVALRVDDARHGFRHAAKGFAMVNAPTAYCLLKVMTDFVPQDTDFEARVRESFARQGAMETIGARLRWVAPGAVEIELPFRADLTQQHGYLHAGIVTAVVDSACGYAAMSLTPPGADVLSVEFKINLLSPAAGELLVARARVVRAGRNVTVCAGDAFMLAGGREKIVATMLGTMMTVKT